MIHDNWNSSRITTCREIIFHGTLFFLHVSSHGWYQTSQLQDHYFFLQTKSSKSLVGLWPLRLVDCRMAVETPLIHQEKKLLGMNEVSASRYNEDKCQSHHVMLISIPVWFLESTLVVQTVTQITRKLKNRKSWVHVIVLEQKPLL